MPELSPEAARDFVRHCHDAVSQPGYGYLLAGDLAGPVEQFVPITTVLGPYRFDPVELDGVKKKNHPHHRYVIGVAFARPGGPVWPSVDDVLAAAQLDPLGTLMIVILDPDTGELGRFRILDGHVEALS